MVISNSKGFHHQNLRKRIHQKYEKYPHPDKFKRFMDKFIFFIAIIGPIMTIPQILKIFVNQTAAGVSLISWSTYIFIGSGWLIYGIIHKEKSIIFANIAWIIVQIFVIAGILIHG